MCVGFEDGSLESLSKEVTGIIRAILRDTEGKLDNSLLALSL